MKNIYISLVLVLICFNISAQEYSISPSSNNLVLSGLDNVYIEGYDGSEILIISPNQNYSKYDKSEGLKLINQSGKADNTGLGINVENEKGSVVIKQVKSNTCGSKEYKMKVPSNMNISYEHSSYQGDILSIRNITGELDVSSNYNSVVLDNVTGPLAIKTVYGSIDAEFSNVSQKGSISLYSVYEYVDVSLPETAQARFNLNTTYGHIYSDLDFEILSEDVREYGNRVIGTFNGKGVDMNITATYSNIYLREK